MFRDLKHIIPYDLPVNDKEAIIYLNRGLILTEALKSQQVPDPLGSVKNTCNFCLYKDQCKKDICDKIMPSFMENKKAITPSQPKNTAFLL